MVNNNLPPGAQPWVRATETLKDSTRARIQRITQDNAIQQFNLASGLGILPEQIEGLDEANLLLPVPVAGTELREDTTLQTMAANTWRKVLDITVNAPPGKTKAQVFVMSTSYVTASGLGAQVFVRSGINGAMAPEAAGAVSGTGVSAAAASLTGISVFITIQAEVKAMVPANITNGSRVNHVRTFYTVVWSA